MTLAPSQSQHTSSRRQFQKDQVETFLRQLNFHNRIKIPDFFFFSNKELLHWNRSESVLVPSRLLTPGVHPHLPLPKAQQAAETSLQKL